MNELAVHLGAVGLRPSAGLRVSAGEPERRGVPAAWIWRGRAASVYEPETRRVAERMAAGTEVLLNCSLEDPEILRLDAAPEAWQPLRTAEDVAAAEERLYAGLAHGCDGYLSQFDRHVSIALSRRLASTRVTPNQITAVSLAVGLAGAALVAFGGYATCLLGTLLAWLSSILDGCDGEIARLKLLFSEAGRRFDLTGDYLVNFSLIAAIAWHVHRERPDLALGPLALLLATGVALSGLTAWWLFLREPQRRQAGVERALQRLAGRDFVYIVIPLAALRHLDWFVYGSAVTQTEMLDVLNRVLGVVTLAVGGIGAISLLVGAIGILTMMWISVGERTAEIGVVRAIGASRSQVVRLFLLEAALLSLTGGALGVLTGVGVGWLLRLAVPALPLRTAPEFVAAALAVSLAVGLSAGVLPARRAAGLDPVRAAASAGPHPSSGRSCPASLGRS